MKTDLPCPKCGSFALKTTEVPGQLICIECGFVSECVIYDCPDRHCCPKGFARCPRCKKGKPTDEGCVP